MDKIDHDSVVDQNNPIWSKMNKMDKYLVKIDPTLKKLIKVTIIGQTDSKSLSASQKIKTVAPSMSRKGKKDFDFCIEFLKSKTFPSARAEGA